MKFTTHISSSYRLCVCEFYIFFLYYKYIRLYLVYTTLKILDPSCTSTMLNSSRRVLKLVQGIYKQPVHYLYELINERELWCEKKASMDATEIVPRWLISTEIIHHTAINGNLKNIKKKKNYYVHVCKRMENERFFNATE